MTFHGGIELILCRPQLSDFTSRLYDFIDATIEINEIGEDKLDLTFSVLESDKFFVNNIDIFGNNVTEESVIRNQLEVDEGDPFNEILQKKSENNLKSLNFS